MRLRRGRLEWGYRQDVWLVLFRLFWDLETSSGYFSFKSYRNILTVSVGVAWYDLWIGVYVDRKIGERALYICLLPCLPIRIIKLVGA